MATPRPPQQATVQTQHYQRLRTALHGQPLPCALVDVDAFDANAQAILQRAGHKPVRLASKSVRCRTLLRRVLDSSPRYRGLMCFTAAEAAWLYQCGFDDLLVAYPSTDAASLAAVCQCIAAGASIYLTVDSPEHLQLLASIASTAGVVLPVSLELDMSLRLPGLNFGVWRSPLRDAAAFLAMAQQIQATPQLRLAGLMGYEAQLAGVPDNAAGQWLRNALIRQLKRSSQRRIQGTRRQVLAALQQAGIALDFVNAGGTGSLEFSAADPGTTEVTAGSGLYCPQLFDSYADFHPQPAAAFALPIVRTPASGMFTCLGGGYPASGASGNDRLPQPWLPSGCRLSALEGAGEVQTPIHYSGAIPLQLGDPILFRHAKAGELCERFQQLHLIQAERIIDTVPTYRGEGQCFL